MNRPKRSVPTVNYQEDSEDDFGSVNSSFNNSANPPPGASSPASELVRQGLNLIANPNNNTSRVLAGVANRLADFPAHRLDPGEPPAGPVQGPGDQLAPVQPPVIMAFEDSNGTDDDKALNNALRVLERFVFDVNDIKFTFQQIEIKMTSAGVKKNFTKFQILSSIIPKHIQDEVKSLLSKGEAEFTDNNAYKLLKQKILKIFAPSEESRIERALQRTLTGLPSQLGRVLVNDICDHELDGCCCRRVVSAIWKRALPIPVRQAVSAIAFDKDNFDTIMGIADSVFNSSRPTGVTVAAVEQPAQTASHFQTPHNPSPLDTAFVVSNPGDPIQAAAQSIVAAVQRAGGGRGRGSGGRGRGGRGSQRSRGTGRSGGSGSGQSRGGHRWANLQRHSDMPPLSTCKKHYVYGKSAHWCEEPASCPWKDFFVPKSQ